MRVKVAIVVAAASASLATTIGLAAPASAGADGCSLVGNIDGHGTQGFACFEAVGEVFKVKDVNGDGHSAVAEWKVGSSSTIHRLWDHDGANNGWETSDQSIAEGVTVHLRTCVGEYGPRDIIGCSAWVRLEA